MPLRAWLAFLAALAIVMPMAAPAQDAGNDPAMLARRAADAVAVMRRLRPASEVFNKHFLAEVPPERLAALVAQLEGLYGKLLRAEDVVRTGPGTASLSLLFERAKANVTLVIEPGHPRFISGLLIGSIAPLGTADPRDLAADFATLPGTAGYVVARLGDNGPVTIQQSRGDQAFAIGSTFKLWVLDAVAEDISAGRLRWDQVVRLGPRSLPSGLLQDWPEDAALTVETLATLMISVSDNTATDTLIRLVGRERLEARVAASGHARPPLMQPFLTSAEAFQLKLGPQAVRDAFARGDAAARRAILEAMPQGITPEQAGIAALAAGPPVAIESAEWFASPSDIVRVFDALRRRGDARLLAILGVAPGMSPDYRKGFAWAGYKGGSEPGVLNLSWMLRRPTGEWFVVTASWNNPAAKIENSRLELLALRLLGLAQ